MNKLPIIVSYAAGLLVSLASAGLSGNALFLSASCFVVLILAAFALAGRRARMRRWTLNRSGGDRDDPEAKNHRRAAFILLLAAFHFLGIFIGWLQIAAMDESQLERFEGRRVHVIITVRSPPELKEDSYRFFGEARLLSDPQGSQAAAEHVLVEIGCRKACPEDLASISEGALLEADARVEQPVTADNSDFDYAAWLSRQGVNAILRISPEDLVISGERRGGLQGLIDALRVHARSALNTGEWGQAGALLQGMVLGDDHVVSDKLIDDFRAAGLLHMLAVSGQNVALLGFIILILLRALRIRKFAAVAFAIVAVAVYVPLTGSGPSIMRAGVVGIMGLLAVLFSRQSDRYHFLALSAAALMSLNPFCVLDPGFQLSYAAVAAIFSLAPVLARPLCFLPGALREATAISAATALASSPITLANFGQISIVTVPANVAAAPAAGPVMFLGVLAVAAQPVFPLLGWSLAAGACLFTGYLIEVAAFFAGAPHAVYHGESPGLLAISAFYAVLAALVLAVAYLRASRLGLQKRETPARSAALLAVAIIIAATIIYWRGHGDLEPAPTTLTVTFFDVGQGDAALIRTPPSESDPDGAAILIDGGPDDNFAEQLRRTGTARLDVVVVSHPDADHLTGLLEVIDQFEVDTVFDAAPPPESEMYAKFLEKIGRREIAYVVSRGGQSVQFGELALDVLGPVAAQPAGDTNAFSVVIKASYGEVDILFPGDAEGETLMALELDEVEVLKFPHHGSSNPATALLLRRLRPAAAVISVGEGNSYHHPHESTMEELARYDVEVFRTDEMGTVTMRAAESGLQFTTER